MQNLRLDRENPRDIGFVEACIVPGIISLEEFKDWIYFVIEHYDGEIPGYFFKILDLKHRFDYNSFEIMGFVPHWEFDESDYDALTGIGFRRGTLVSDDQFTREEALKALERKPYIEKKFYEMFPFLKEKDGVKDI